MPPLAALERFFERLFERPTARIFRTRLQPVQLQRRIERAMESERLAASDRTLVPNRYTVHLNPRDVAAFGEFGSTLAAELADGALVFARAHHYTLVDRPRVELVSDPAIDRADIVVRARFADPIVERAAEPQRPAGEPGANPEDVASGYVVVRIARGYGVHVGFTGMLGATYDTCEVVTWGTTWPRGPRSGAPVCA